MNYTEKELDEIKRQRKQLLALLLKKSFTTHRELVETAENDFIRANMCILKEYEREQFPLYFESLELQKLEKEAEAMRKRLEQIV